MEGLGAPNRDAMVRALCSECRATADEQCPRCNRPLCVLHLPPEGARCSPCEADFGVRAQARREDLGILAPVTVALALMLGIGGSIATSAIFANAVVGSLVFLIGILGAFVAVDQLTPALQQARERNERTLFLAECPSEHDAPKQLAPPSGDEEPS